MYGITTIFLYASFRLGQAPDAGWFNYVPLSSLEYNPGPNIDVYALGMILLGVSTTVGSINFVVTLLRMRAPGMPINRLTILVWGTMAASIANLLAVLAVSLAVMMLWFDRQVGTHFFGATSTIISIPSTVATFAWIATIWLGRPVYRVPFLFFSGFVLLFVVGGVSGVMTAAVSVDWQLTGTYVVVAHLHYVLLGINVFPVLGDSDRDRAFTCRLA